MKFFFLLACVAQIGALLFVAPRVQHPDGPLTRPPLTRNLPG